MANFIVFWLTLAGGRLIHSKGACLYLNIGRKSLTVLLFFQFPGCSAFVPWEGVLPGGGGKRGSSIDSVSKNHQEGCRGSWQIIFWSERRVVSDGLSWCLGVLTVGNIFLMPAVMSNHFFFFFCSEHRGDLFLLYQFLKYMYIVLLAHFVSL